MNSSLLQHHFHRVLCRSCNGLPVLALLHRTRQHSNCHSPAEKQIRCLQQNLPKYGQLGYTVAIFPYFLKKSSLVTSQDYVHHGHQQRKFSTVLQPPKFSKISKTGLVSPQRKVPWNIKRPPYIKSILGVNVFDHNALDDEGESEVKTDHEMEGMRNACRLARVILELAGDAVQPGITTDDIDELVHCKCIEYGAYPSPLLFKGFPKSVCTSVNNVACHGIPDDRPLKDGDIINIDVTVYFEGFHGDVSETYTVGSVDEDGLHLVEAASICRDEAIRYCGPDVPFSVIGEVIECTAESHGFSVIPQFCGHGIGRHFHTSPVIYHFRNDQPGNMKEGMTFTIEPIITEGEPSITILSDGWTAVSCDNSRSAQAEHTILITEDGHEVLTQCT